MCSLRTGLTGMLPFPDSSGYHLSANRF